jgi:hypothetical protein
MFKYSYLLLLDQAISLHFRSGFDRPLNLPQYPGSNNYFNIPEEKDKPQSTKHTYKTKDRVTRTPVKTGGELRRCEG